MTVAFVTLGCKVNQVDSETLCAGLLQQGFAQAQTPAQADVVIINSCAVTRESERKTRQKLRHCRALASESVLVLTGCAVQVEENLPLYCAEADVVISHAQFSALPQCIEEFLQSRATVLRVCAPDAKPMPTPQCFSEQKRARAFVKIADGCNHRCAYCVIPHTRGAVRSKTVEALAEEITALVRQSVAEVVLVGINLLAFGRDNGALLVELLRWIDCFSGVKRLRLGSLEPDLLTQEILDTLLQTKAFCPHFHLSLQSGCARTLRAMRRRYTPTDYAALVAEIRKRWHNATFATDFMVGFPGETDEDFAESLDFAQQMQFAHMHVFPYSPRPHTPAAAFGAQVSPSQKTERVQAAMALAAQMRAAALQAQVGCPAEVLVEEPLAEGGLGHSRNFLPVVVANAQPGQTVQVRIARADAERCYGEPSDAPLFSTS